VIVVEGKRTREMGGAELDARIAAAAATRVVVDVGTGDGRFAYATATAHSDWFVIGIDAIAERLDTWSAKAVRKPAKGGRPNVLFVRASAEQPPAELQGRAHAVHVLLPWGALLVGTMLADPAVLDGLTALARPGAELTVVFNAEVWEESTPKDMADLPAVTVEYVEQTLAPRYAARGIEISEARELSAQEVMDLPTTWSKRLARSHRGHPKFVLARGAVAAQR
jgi:16S rRNA (adenine(1408)-N(1))-methyltransferase